MALAMHRVLDGWNIVCFDHSVAVSDRVAPSPKPRANSFDKQLRLCPSREVSALVELVVVDQLGIGPLGPAARSLVELVGERAHGNRDRDAFNTKKVERTGLELFPVETGRRNPRV